MSSIVETNPDADADAAVRDASQSQEYSIYEAIHDRYLYDDNDLNESLKNFTLLFNNSDKTESTRTNSTGDSPRKLNKLNSRAIVLSEKGICCVGNDEQVSELAQICPNLQELDLSCNKFKQWSEIRKILNTFKHLKFLNLSSNSDLCSNSPKEKEKETTEREKENEEQVVSIFTPNVWSSDSIGANLSTLILNRCYIDMTTLERLLPCLPSLDELYLAHNNYNRVEFSPEFVNSKLRTLYFNNNLVEDWNEVIKLGGHFDQLETLVLSENPINSIKAAADASSAAAIFKNLKHLTINKLNLTDWNDLERLKNEFAALKHLKIQNIPLLNELKTDDDKFTVLMAYFGEFIDFLNGSPVTREERDKAERNFLRYFMEKEDQVKPPRYFELEAKHGKIDKLVEINFDKDLFANVKIKCGDKIYYDKIDTRQTVGAFKSYLEKYANCKASQFRLFYMDYETVDALGPDELRLMNITLGRFHLKDGDEFEIVPNTQTAQNKPQKK